MRFFLPLRRDIKTVPPLISLIRGLIAEGHEVHLFTYYNSPGTLAGVASDKLKITTISDHPYPASLAGRIIALIRSYLRLWKEVGKMDGCDYFWISSWDYRGLEKLAARPNVQAKIVYQSHEYEPHRFKYCRLAHAVVVPEENRGWLTFVNAGLAARPLLLPNCPIDHPREFPEKEADPVLDALEAEGKRIVLYQGYLALKERCIPELLEAISLCDERMVLCIMPASRLTETLRQSMDELISRFRLQNRVFFIETRVAPAHMRVIARAHIGIGLYRPTSINQVYCAPNRLYEFTGFGTPVILPDAPGMNQIAGRYAGVLTCNPENPAAISAALMSLMENEHYQKARAGAVAFFQHEADYQASLREVISKLPAP
jgi:glycosyltransferase involved in cell wall biosynthesis